MSAMRSMCWATYRLILTTLALTHQRQPLGPDLEAYRRARRRTAEMPRTICKFENRLIVYEDRLDNKIRFIGSLILSVVGN